MRGSGTLTPLHPQTWMGRFRNPSALCRPLTQEASSRAQSQAGLEPGSNEWGRPSLAIRDKHFLRGLPLVHKTFLPVPHMPALCKDARVLAPPFIFDILQIFKQFRQDVPDGTPAQAGRLHP